MGKRKRDAVDDHRPSPINGSAKEQKTSAQRIDASANNHITIQIVVGSYERVLHGITAEVPQFAVALTDKDSDECITFSDTFLFHAHTSAIRCLALSPPTSSKDTSAQNQRVLLATGSSDERINLYHLSASPPPRNNKAPPIPSLTSNAVTEDPKNRELGSLIHHSGPVTALHFPTRSKLLSSAEDSTIAIVRSRDWTVLSTIKAPIPKAQGRPSGDTAPPGCVPAGVNDFAVHPSMKLMLSVGKGEKCMRLWNLVIGKKAGVLNFGREILQGVGEGKWGSGEGRKVVWNQSGDEFVVGFERGAVVFGLDSKPRGRILPSPPTKIHQLRYLSTSKAPENPRSNKVELSNVLAVSTEDGRVIFYTTTPCEASGLGIDSSEAGIPNCRLLGQLGGRSTGLGGRIKDFDILEVSYGDLRSGNPEFITVTGSSDGAVRLWRIKVHDILYSLKANGSPASENQSSSMRVGSENTDATKPSSPSPRQIGTLAGVYETGNRITCLRAFVMVGHADSGGNGGNGGEHPEEEMNYESNNSSDGSDDS
ncbi:hypothetical protein FGG08_002199 [Glutinoglossum americanum]|uniref:Uncharacterized protein n=1 Tax=Glutinoglossum americanum TaxID=1670608 RepID=A0A9P8IFN6_9PEZI|nr:hypothetical protein FGG08_002199 [Glutinoglossum americanum]